MTNQTQESNISQGRNLLAMALSLHQNCNPYANSDENEAHTLANELLRALEEWCKGTPESRKFDNAVKNLLCVTLLDYARQWLQDVVRDRFCFYVAGLQLVEETGGEQVADMVFSYIQTKQVNFKEDGRLKDLKNELSQTVDKIVLEMKKV